jgi:hypothetical protein
MARMADGWLPTKKNMDLLTEEFRVRHHDGLKEINIFEPELTTLKGMPPGWLLDKKMPLPFSAVRAKDFDVQAGIGKLIHVGKDESMIHTVLEGWRLPGDAQRGLGATHRDLAFHIEILTQLQTSLRPDDRLLFELIFTGRHRSALEAIENKAHGQTWKEEELLLTLVRQLLVLCAFDVQRLTYFLRESAQEPLPGILERVEDEFGYTRASTIKSALMSSLACRDAAFDEFQPFKPSDLNDMTLPDSPKRRGAPASDPKRESPTSRLQRGVSPVLRSMTREQVIPIGHALNRSIPALQQARSGSEGFLLDAMKNGIELPDMLPNYRFSGLGPTECLLVALLRLVQAEQHYMVCYERYLEGRGRPGATPVRHIFFTKPSKPTGGIEHSSCSFGLPAFPFRMAKPTGGMEHSSCSFGLPAFQARMVRIGRVIELAGEYRRLILKPAGRSGKDNDFGASSADRDFSKPMKKAKRFLLKMGEQRLADHSGPADCRRRTFYLLDVHPGARLAL